MRLTLFFTFLITNIVSAALPAESCKAEKLNQACTYFRWNPYNLQAPRTVTSDPRRLISPPTLIAPLPAPSPIGTRDHLSEHPPLSENRPETLLIDTQRLCDTRNLTSLDTQQVNFDHLLQNYVKFSASCPPLSPDRITGIFQHLQDFLNGEYVRLGSRSTDQEYPALMQQYQQLLRFHRTVITLALFSSDQIEKLHCFHVTTLIGIANVCGIRRDNTSKLKYLEQALSLTKSIITDVKDPYRTKRSFYVQKVIDLCKEKLSKTRNYLSHNKLRNNIVSPRR